MTVRHIENDLSPEEYDKIAPHPLQSWEWGEARKKMGTAVERLGLFREDLLQSVFQMTLHPLPFGIGSIGYLPRSVVPNQEVVNFLTAYAQKNNLVFIKLEPYEEHHLSQGKIEQLAKDFPLLRSHHPLFPDWTQILDLNKKEDELLKNLKSKTRYNIRLAQKKGVTVKEESNKKGFEIFTRLYFETCRRQNYFGHNLSYHKTIWENLRSKIAHIYIAYYNDTPLAAYELFLFHDRAYYVYGGTSLAYKQVMASNLLMWEAIQFAQRKGCKLFDMWGSLPPDYPQHHPWAGFTRFKEGYGTQFTRLTGSYDLVVQPQKYVLYSVLFRLRENYLRLKRIVA